MILETVVCYIFSIIHCESYTHQMVEYWSHQPMGDSISDSASTDMNTVSSGTSILSHFDQYRQSLVELAVDEGWAAELRHYLKDMPVDVTKDTDIVLWWQVSQSNIETKIFH